MASLVAHLYLVATCCLPLLMDESSTGQVEVALVHRGSIHATGEIIRRPHKA